MAMRRPRPAGWLIAACGLWQVGLGLYFIFLRPALLPEDLRYMDVNLQALEGSAPRLASWLGKVFLVMGGFMAGTGTLVSYFGLCVMPVRLPGTALVLAVTGAATVGSMSIVNFVLGSDFQWVLILPALIWTVAVVLYVRAIRSA